MESSTTIRKMLANGQIIVPSYQRAYSWERDKQVSQFLQDLEEYRKSQSHSAYYFGHFLFENKGNDIYHIVDGQQRLTTIVIFVAALFQRLKEIHNVNGIEKLPPKLQAKYGEMIKYYEQDRFQTVEYDRLLFKDVIIDNVKNSETELQSADTESKRRFLQAFQYFYARFVDCDEEKLLRLLDIVSDAACTTHAVTDESEAIQMFIFQNNRGKKPTDLEIIKAELMFYVHLYGISAKDSLLNEIKDRFEIIYKSISSIEYKISEDDVLRYTIRVYSNNLNTLNDMTPQEWIAKRLEEKGVQFIQEFVLKLSQGFESLKLFFTKDDQDTHQIHSFISLGNLGAVMPFVLKAYNFSIPMEEKVALFRALESVLLRHRLSGTRADLTARLNGVYQEFIAENKNITPILAKIDELKTTNYEWWGYWTNDIVKKALLGNVYHPVAKFLLWKYENHLESQNANGYALTRFDEVKSPELEHISPKTPRDQSEIASGYDDYDNEFETSYLHSLGNLLLISKSQNCSLGNCSFDEKRMSYKDNHLAQQREIFSMTENNPKWKKAEIEKRRDKIVEFIMSVI
ncbi:DUF262 domain-containing protein [Pasteurella bettyae]|uniref:PF03235 family protein n=1 Tax=Pasteurella bettyae CCUG 2042 TaxID=1095749 RepID=I3DFH6_9PAST|nr:DUF262 domain-containing protein [Pasteurella bettyae]EIJ70469.1 PF03235 family protein [Pasteurella bettyae CCUG 2042]SUB21087.1 Uncharacterized conserved protein [Pasteurella bettyae]